MDDTRARILDAAGEIFSVKGFDDTTVREICSKARANIAAVNYHFRDKQSLYLETVKEAHCRRCSVPDFGWDDSTSPEQKLFDYILQMVQDMVDDAGPGWHVPLLMREMARPTQACEHLVREYISPKFKRLQGIVDEFLGPDAPQEQRHLFAFTIVGQCLVYRFHRPVGKMLVGEEGFQRLLDARKLADHIFHVCLAALRSAPTAVPETVP